MTLIKYRIFLHDFFLTRKSLILLDSFIFFFNKGMFKYHLTPLRGVGLCTYVIIHFFTFVGEKIQLNFKQLK